MIRKVDEVRGKLDEIEARQSAGQYQRAAAMAREAVAAVRAVPYAPLKAEALQANARLENEVGELEAGLLMLREAFTVANAAKDDVRAAKVIRDLLFTMGVRAQRFADAEALWSFGRASASKDDQFRSVGAAGCWRIDFASPV